MINILKTLAENLINCKDGINIYNKLEKIFEENCMYLEQCNCIEKIWNINKEHELLKRIGDILFKKVKDKENALEAYDKYLQYSQPEFYNNYKACFKDTQNIDSQKPVETENSKQEISILYDKYSVIISIMTLLLKEKEYDALIDFNNNYLLTVEQKINMLIHENRDNYKYLKEINDLKIYFSNLLSTIVHHNDINNLAIRLNPQNIKAHINIIDDLITYENYEACLKFYNCNFAKIFNYQILDNVSDICFILSEHYQEELDFYKTLIYQKKAIELSLNKD